MLPPALHIVLFGRASNLRRIRNERSIIMGLDIFIERSPLSTQTDEQNFSTGLRIWVDEWEDLFQNVLHAPIEVERREGEDRADFLNRREKLFQEDLTSKGYEMLGRIWYIFSDAFFAPSEVDKLLNECMELRQKVENKKALSALEKLIFACHKALKVKSGVFLACD